MVHLLLPCYFLLDVAGSSHRLAPEAKTTYIFICDINETLVSILLRGTTDYIPKTPGTVDHNVLSMYTVPFLCIGSNILHRPGTKLHKTLVGTLLSIWNLELI